MFNGLTISQFKSRGEEEEEEKKEKGKRRGEKDVGTDATSGPSESDFLLCAWRSEERKINGGRREEEEEVQVEEEEEEEPSGKRGPEVDR